jgi:hypothetical protein
MKLKHCLIIKTAIEKVIESQHKLGKMKPKNIICAASDFNWDVFMAAKVEGDTLSFIARELYPYLTSGQIIKTLMKITGIDGSGICGSGVKRC